MLLRGSACLKFFSCFIIAPSKLFSYFWFILFLEQIHAKRPQNEHNWRAREKDVSTHNNRKITYANFILQINRQTHFCQVDLCARAFSFYTKLIWQAESSVKGEQKTANVRENKRLIKSWTRVSMVCVIYTHAIYNDVSPQEARKKPNQTWIDHWNKITFVFAVVSLLFLYLSFISPLSSHAYSFAADRDVCNF